MSLLSAQGRKGESTILGYVLLIVLAVGMAGGVFAYLKLYVPKDVAQCPSDVKLSIEDVTCSGRNITVTVGNRGLFSVQGAYIRVGNVSSAYKTVVNCPDPSRPLPPDCTLYFNQGPPNFVLDPLKPGERNTGSYNYTETGVRQIEIEPIYIIRNGTRAICTNAIVSREVTCS